MVRAVISELCYSPVHCMNNPPVGGGAGGGNNPSGVGRGSGSGAGRGAGNPTAAGIGSSTGADVGSSSAGFPESIIQAALGATKKDLLEKSIKSAQIQTEQECKSLSMSDSEIEKAKLDIEQHFRARIERISREGPTSASDHAMVEAERGVEERLRLAFKELGLPNHDDDVD